MGVGPTPAAVSRRGAPQACWVSPVLGLPPPKDCPGQHTQRCRAPHPPADCRVLVGAQGTGLPIPASGEAVLEAIRERKKYSSITCHFVHLPCGARRQAGQALPVQFPSVGFSPSFSPSF